MTETSISINLKPFTNKTILRSSETVNTTNQKIKSKARKKYNNKKVVIVETLKVFAYTVYETLITVIDKSGTCLEMWTIAIFQTWLFYHKRQTVVANYYKHEWKRKHLPFRKVSATNDTVVAATCKLTLRYVTVTVCVWGLRVMETFRDDVELCTLLFVSYQLTALNNNTELCGYCFYYILSLTCTIFNFTSIFAINFYG